MSMQIVILRRSVGQRDAIDREIERMHAILRPKYDCRVFAEERHNPNVSYIARGEFEKLAAVPDLLLVCYPEADWEYGIEAMRRAKGKVVVYADGVQITLDKGARVSDVDIESGRDGWYSDIYCTLKIDSEAVLADGMRLYSKPIVPEEAGEKQDLPLGLIVLSMSALLIFAGAARRFI